MSSRRSGRRPRGDETRRSIVQAAGQLFAERGFDAVTMREIAKAAGCSHTAIYMHFEDKGTLLYELASGPLQSLRKRLESVVRTPSLSPDDKLREVSKVFIHFSLTNRSMYTVFFMTRSRRVDEEPGGTGPVAEVGRQRNELFALLRRAVATCLTLEETDDLALAYARIYFFTLHGVVGTYTASPEPPDQLLDRLKPTFDLALDVLLAGFKQTVRMEVTQHES